MDAARRARYLDKLAHADDRLGLAEEWLAAARASTKDRLAAYKAFQEAAEAATDLAAMAVADSGRVPKDDYTNLAICAELGLASPSLLQRCGRPWVCATGSCTSTMASTTPRPSHPLKRWHRGSASSSGRWSVG